MPRVGRSAAAPAIIRSRSAQDCLMPALREASAGCTISYKEYVPDMFFHGSPKGRRPCQSNRMGALLTCGSVSCERLNPWALCGFLSGTVRARRAQGETTAGEWRGLWRTLGGGW